MHTLTHLSCCAGLYCENSRQIVEEAGRILSMPLDTVFNLQLPDGNPDELAPPFPGLSLYVSQVSKAIAVQCQVE